MMIELSLYKKNWNKKVREKTIEYKNNKEWEANYNSKWDNNYNSQRDNNAIVNGKL